VSSDVHYKGIIKKLNIIGEDDIANYIKSLGYKKEDYHDDYIEFVQCDLDKEFIVLNNELWKILKKEADENLDVFNIFEIGDNKYRFQVKYYNGGIGFTEALEYALDNLGNNEDINSKKDQTILELIRCIEMFTDQKNDTFPNGEMIRMHGGCGDGNYICEYNFSTIEKARKLLKKVKDSE
jgi:hypothetical protein